MHYTSVMPHFSRGFSLVEILVALLLFAFSTLGLMSLQVKSQQSSHQQYLRNTAMQLLQDIAGRMRANKDAVAAGDYTFDNAASSFPDCATENCTPAELAQFDSQHWLGQVEHLLPNAVFENTHDGERYRLGLFWYHPLADSRCTAQHDLVTNNCVQLEIIL